jgi:hypothetical protein
MPGFDGKGPMGKGPMTGRKGGKCRVAKTTQNANTASDQPLEDQVTNLGAGRGGKPRGGGKGNCFGGGKGKGQSGGGGFGRK